MFFWKNGRKGKGSMKDGMKEDGQMMMFEEEQRALRGMCKEPLGGASCIYLRVCPDWYKEKVNCEGKEGKSESKV